MSLKLKKIGCILASAVCIYLTPLWSADNAGTVFDGGLGVAAYGMGGSVVAGIKDSSAIYWNPAGLASLNKTDIKMQSHTAYETQFLGATMASRFDKWVIGSGLLNAATSGIKRTEHSGDRTVSSGDTFGYNALGVWVGAGRSFGNWRTGGTVKWLSEKLDDNTASGVGLDIGLQHQTRSWITLGLSTINLIQPVMTWDTDSNTKEKIPLLVRPGAEVTIGNFQLSTQAEMRENRSLTVSTGAAYKIMDILVIRAGHNTRELSLGTSLLLEGLSIDFTWSSAQTESIPNTYRVGAGYAF